MLFLDDTSASVGDVVVVYDGRVILREGDLVDLNGDVLLDENVRISAFSDITGAAIANGGGSLGNDGNFYFTTSLTRDGTGIGEAFLSVAVPEPATAVPLALAGLASRGRRRD